MQMMGLALRKEVGIWQIRGVEQLIHDGAKIEKEEEPLLLGFLIAGGNALSLFPVIGVGLREVQTIFQDLIIDPEGGEHEIATLSQGMILT
jgi:helix-turn-helix protein